MDAKEALQYVYCVCLAADQGEVGKEHIEIAWEQARRIIVLSNGGPGWEELVGGYRQDGSRFVSLSEISLLVDIFNIPAERCGGTRRQTFASARQPTVQ